MLVIRLFRVGKKNQPVFKIVVTDKRNPSRAGRFTEEVGFYNPLTKEKIFHKDRIQYWISKGAKPSPTIHNLLIKEEIIQGKKILVHKKSKKAQEKPDAPAGGGPAPQESPVQKTASTGKEEEKK